MPMPRTDSGVTTPFPIPALYLIGNTASPNRAIGTKHNGMETAAVSLNACPDLQSFPITGGLCRSFRFTDGDWKLRKLSAVLTLRPPVWQQEAEIRAAAAGAAGKEPEDRL